MPISPRHSIEQYQGILVKKWCDDKLDNIHNVFKSYTRGKKDVDTAKSRQANFAELVGEVDEFKNNLSSLKGQIVVDVEGILNTGGSP